MISDGQAKCTCPVGAKRTFCWHLLSSRSNEGDRRVPWGPGSGLTSSQTHGIPHTTASASLSLDVPIVQS